MMTAVSFYAGLPNYARHILPIAAELRARGVDVSVRSKIPGQDWGAPLVDVTVLAPTVVVASAFDAQAVAMLGRKVVYVEHGAGQTYVQESGERLEGFGYPGGPGLEHVALFLAPSERVGSRWRASYPQATVEIVGCPVLDQHMPSPKHGNVYGVALGELPDRIVAITSHWRAGPVPEMFPALDYFMGQIPALQAHLAVQGIELVGHAHPRIARRLAEDWKRLGVRFEPDPDVILATSSLLIVDTSSLAYEAAAVGLPTLNLNSPQWRRDVKHGLRFWDQVPGLQCDRPEDLIFMVDLALEDPCEAQKLRRKAAAYVYHGRDGLASSRAADAILAL